MANLTNSAKLIEEMEKKAYKTELPTVNNATVTVAVNGNTGTNSFTTNQASNSTLKITVGKSDVGLGNVDNTSDANKPISTATQAALDLKADKSEISSVYKYKGSKANYDALPSSGNVTGDVWNVETAHTTAPIFPAGSNVAWDGSAWDVLGGTVDLSNYAQKSEVLTKTNTTSFTPTGDYQPATKKYVDDNAGTEYNAGEGISIGDIILSDMQGPCQTGFHIPLNSEWGQVVSIMTGLNLNTQAQRSEYLHIPIFNTRNTDGTITTSYKGMLWSSDSYQSGYGYVVNISGSSGPSDNNIQRCGYGQPIRPFKNSFVVPESTRTVITGTLGSGGIFWNETEGIISITGNGTTGVTIADKNLGATVVYNYNDTLSEENQGKVYQRGNNYGFPSTGTITKTSSTKVDVTGYGPGNYYYSDTWITNYNRPVTFNSNIRGGTSQGTSTVTNAITNTGVLSVNGQTGDVNIVDDTTFGSSWDGDTTHAPSKNAVYDAIGNIETLLAAL